MSAAENDRGTELARLRTMNGRLRVLIVGLASGLGACSAQHAAPASAGADAQPPDAQHADAPPADAGPPPGFLFFTWTAQSELGTCCQSCGSSVDIRNATLTVTLTGAVPCHVTLTSEEATSFVQLATSPDVVHALTDQGSCTDAAPSFATLTVGFDDGSTFEKPAIDTCDDVALRQLVSSAFQLDEAHCIPVTCIGAADSGTD
jgi:hypothetical protein